MNGPHFASDEHALRTGFLTGYLLLSGVRAATVYDDKGYATAEIDLEIALRDDDEAMVVRVRVVG